jgi:predicted site-specific integrase-resolvase
MKEAIHHTPAELATPQDLAAKYAVRPRTILDWFHAGKIPAEVAIGRTFRFDPKKVEEALREQAEQTQTRQDGGVIII